MKEKSVASKSYKSRPIPKRIMIKNEVTARKKCNKWKWLKKAQIGDGQQN